MTIAIIGAGAVGTALAHAFSRAGEIVVLGVRDRAKERAIAALGPKVSSATVANAVAATDVVILAVPYGVAEGVVRGIPDWQGKILVDVTNPLAPGLAGLTIGTTGSGAEQIARAARNARVVKAFNTTGAGNLENANYRNGRVFMPVCGDDRAARQHVMELAGRIGFDPVDLGELKAARYLEPFAMTWIHLAAKMDYGRNFAFSVMRR